MADKLLKSIKFPTLPDRYVIGDTTLTEEGAAADAKAVGEALATKVDTKGRYEDLIVGGAEQLMANGYESDSEPYLFRPTGGSADVGNREYLDKIVGGTVAWNQLMPINGIDNTVTVKGVTFTNNGDGSVTINGTATDAISGNDFRAISPATVISGHKYLFDGCPVGGSRTTYFIYDGYSLRDTGNGTVAIPQLLRCVFYAESGTSFNNAKFVPQIHDLTAMFGSTIADYIYSLEQATAGAGVAWFRNYFPNDYYPYDPGTLRSVEGVSAHETVGFNQWDEEWENGWWNYQTGVFTASSSYFACKSKIAVFPNTEYYWKCPTNVRELQYYDANGEPLGRRNSYAEGYANTTFTTPDGCYYLTFYFGSSYGITYNHDICINLSDPTRNGEYEPYVKHTYPLDSSLTLRGVPKLVDGKLAFDGDIYPPSGEVQRRYGLRAYQNGDESLADAITDGTNTVYKLATTTTEQAEPYQNLQICDDWGTEEFVTDSIVPVGHETRYPHDLKKKIETAPDSPSADGAYLMKRSGGKNTYMALPSTPSANGAYVLTVTVSGGTASYSWTAKE